MQRHEGGYYIRLTVHDRPGVAAGVATRMAEATSRSRASCRSAGSRGHQGPARAAPGAGAARAHHLRGNRVVDPLGARQKSPATGFCPSRPQVIRIEREEAKGSPHAHVPRHYRPARARSSSASSRSNSFASPSAPRSPRRGFAAAATRRRPTRPPWTPCGAS
jgi:hypothetical protein